MVAPIKGLHGDRISKRATATAACVWLVLWLICLIVGATGPSAFETVETTKSFACNNAACDVTWNGLLNDLSPLNQIMYVKVAMDRPLLGGSGPSVGKPAMLDLPLRVPVNFELSVDVDGDDGPTTRVANATHSANMRCARKEATCDAFTLFYEAHVDYSAFRVKAAFKDMLAWWTTQTATPLMPVVTLHFSLTYVKESYTNFENGFKAFFVTASCMVFATFFSLLYCKRCDKSEDVEDTVAGIFIRASPNSSQHALLALTGLLIFANDPTFILQLTDPSFGLTAFYAVCLVTFLTGIFLFFLIQIHLAALQSEAGLAWDIDVKAGGSRLGCCFWAPKLVLMTFFWTVSLSSYLVTRYLQLSDPAFSLLEGSPSIGRLFVGLLVVLVVFYFLHVFALLVIAFRNWRRMRFSNKIFIVFSLSTFIIMVAGVFANVFSPDLETSGAFLTVFGAANLYVWFMCFFYMPDRRLSHEEILEAERKAGVDTTGVMGGGSYPYSDVVGEGEVTLHDIAGAAAEEGGEAVVVVDDNGRPLRIEYVYGDDQARLGLGAAGRDGTSPSHLPHPGEDEGIDMTDFDAPTAAAGGDEYGYESSAFGAGTPESALWMAPTQPAAPPVAAKSYTLRAASAALPAAEEQVFAIDSPAASRAGDSVFDTPAATNGGTAEAAAAPAPAAVPPKVQAKLASKASNPFADMS